jgi:hypothetical protein
MVELQTLGQQRELLLLLWLLPALPLLLLPLKHSTCRRILLLGTL